MRLRRDKAAYTVGRASWRSSFLGDPGAKFLCGKLERGTKKEKSSKKERKEGLWKLTLLMGIRKERGFPQQLEKSLAKDARLFHSSHRPNNKDLSIMFCRQRSTLIRLTFGPKDGEHLKPQGYSFHFGRHGKSFLECDPVFDALLEHIHWQSAPVQHFIVEGANIEFIAELILGVLS